MIRFFALILLLVMSGSVAAQQYRGKFLCDYGCGSESNAAGSAIIANGETRAFIASVVNSIVFGSQIVPSGSWKVGDTFDVCDGNKCEGFIYQAMGAFVRISVTDDDGTGYKNEQSQAGLPPFFRGCGGSGGSYIDIPLFETIRTVMRVNGQPSGERYDSYLVGFTTEWRPPAPGTTRIC